MVPNVEEMLENIMIRHCVEESNVNENLVITDPTKIRHVVISGGRIESMSGLIDPASHLNLDYPDHKVITCVIAEKFEINAKVKFNDQGLVFARVDISTLGHYGNVDYTQRLFDMIEAVKNRRIRKMKRRKLTRNDHS
ncbi:MAG TPA: hypothetical protein VEH06_10420 [Candidatus Bathyarchaeia archaeon]|nr:hypothetical protein [Candidatus Bathyarchaeia archaeon]